MKQRGYLMLEVTVGGAMCAVILAGMMVFVASGRVQNTAASREIVANQLVNEKLEQKRAETPGPTAVAATTVTVAGGKYDVTVATSTTGSPETRKNPGGGSDITIPFVDVTVTVAFQIDDSGRTKTRTSTGTMRVYQ